ncbi:transporter [Paucibacter sp. PLA-PC-4]|uniref:transporter n=1 Tax=Paucibacter sp. PLA-PC-4 TaxID=2993655 RepID=UPI0022491589|nr:transporter [Paucibacter sp. PLA-PC-4]MCX2863004.1 transporter [Paucibacter sp. PLA-PC-4]
MNTTPTATLASPADDHGLICGYLFQAGQPARSIATDAAQHWLHRDAKTAQADSEADFIWLHFNLTHTSAHGWLRAHTSLPHDFHQSLREGSRSTRITRLGERLMAVINDVTFDFSFDPENVATLWLSLEPGLVVSARVQPLRSVDRLRRAVGAGDVIASPVALLEHLLSDQADELQHIVRSASDKVDDIEDAMLARRNRLEGGDELARLRRLSVRLQRLLAPEPGALLRLLANPPAWLNAEERDRLRRVNDEFAVALRDIVSLHERVKLLQDESASHVAEQNNRSLFTLTMVTVLALPINLFAGLMGMNVGGIPLANHSYGFWLMLLLIATFTALAAWLALRRLTKRQR